MSIPLVVVLGGAEIVLRVLGYGFDPHFFRRDRIGGRDCYVASEEFGLRFFPRSLARFPPPVVMPAKKAPGVIRIFILGESAAMGDPRPNYGAGCYLEALLAGRYPGARFEIVNTGVTAINSHAILPIARECARHDGDLWIVYMGNNEMVGPFGAVTVFGARAPPLWLVRAQLQLRQLRLFQTLSALAQNIRKAGSGSAQWQGMEMFVQNQVLPDDASKQRVYHNFERNLDDILSAGVKCHARIVLSTVAVNLRDCPPFGSDSGEGLTATNRAAFEQYCQDGIAAQRQGRFADARSAFERAIELCPKAADPKFHLADCLLSLSNAPAARAAFQEAADDDTLPFRADSRINGAIRAAAGRFAGESVALCDAAKILNDASPDAVSGDNLFYEHVHLNPDGNYALALAWAGEIETLLKPEIKRGAKPSWASQAECEEWIGLTDWNRISILEDILRRIQRPPFSGQFENAKHVIAIEREISGLRLQLTDGAAARAREVYVEALRRSPEDFRLHENFAEFLEARREWKPAIAERKKVCELIPHSYFPHYALGLDLKDAGQLQEAHAALSDALALKPDAGEVWLELGTVSGRQGNWEQARQELENARRIGPEDAHAALFLGEVLWKLDRRNEALASLRDAIRINPSDWQPHFRLASDLAQQSQLSEAEKEYREALRLNPASAKTRLGLAAVLLTLGREAEAAAQLDEILQAEPENQMAAELRRRIRSN